MFLYGNWLKLSIVTRMKIADKFGIKKVGTVHVFDNVVQSDGYSVRDVEKALTTESIRQFLETEENDLVKLWDLLINKFENKTPIAKIEENLVQKEIEQSVNNPTTEEKTFLPKLTPQQKEQAERSLHIAPNKDEVKIEVKRKKRATKAK